jgi:hypothetical protein
MACPSQEREPEGRGKKDGCLFFGMGRGKERGERRRREGVARLSTAFFSNSIPRPPKKVLITEII